MKNLMILSFLIIFTLSCRDRTNSNISDTTANNFAALMKTVNTAKILYALDNESLDEGLKSLELYAQNNKAAILAKPESNPTFLVEYSKNPSLNKLKYWANTQINYDIHFVAKDPKVTGSLKAETVFFLFDNSIYKALTIDEVPAYSFDGFHPRIASFSAPFRKSIGYLNVEFNGPSYLYSFKQGEENKAYFYLSSLNKTWTKPSWIKEPPLSYVEVGSTDKIITNFNLSKSIWSLSFDNELSEVKDLMLNSTILSLLSKIDMNKTNHQLSKSRIAILKKTFEKLNSFKNQFSNVKIGEVSQKTITKLQKIIQSAEVIDSKSNDFQL